MLETMSLRLAAALHSVTVRGWRREEGQTLVEYALILVLISIASITFLVAVSGKINTVLQQITDTL
jgi:Flp pilus assembly pilin Flp